MKAEYVHGGSSYFDGTLGGLIGVSIISALLCIVTLGFGAPWAMCIKYKWKARHTIIEGHRLRFMGTGIGLFGQWIKWMLLTIVTLTIYAWFIGIKLEQWRVANTVFE
jgi:uncharacterized membrane protein YjgN (DUF898 family)